MPDPPILRGSGASMMYARSCAEHRRASTEETLKEPPASVKTHRPWRSSQKAADMLGIAVRKRVPPAKRASAVAKVTTSRKFVARFDTNRPQERPPSSPRHQQQSRSESSVEPQTISSERMDHRYVSLLRTSVVGVGSTSTRKCRRRKRPCNSRTRRTRHLRDNRGCTRGSQHNKLARSTTVAASSAIQCH